MGYQPVRARVDQVPPRSNRANLHGSERTSPEGLCLAVLQTRKASAILQVSHALRQLWLALGHRVGTLTLQVRVLYSLRYLGFRGVDEQGTSSATVMQITRMDGRFTASSGQLAVVLWVHLAPSAAVR